MDAQRHNSQCCSIRRHSDEVVHKHQKSSERNIKRRNHTVMRHCETPYHRTDPVDFTILELKVLPYPVYSPDLSLCGYGIFGLFKTFFLEGKRFSTDEEVKRSKKRSTIVCYFLEGILEIISRTLAKMYWHGRRLCRTLVVKLYFHLAYCPLLDISFSATQGSLLIDSTLYKLENYILN